MRGVAYLHVSNKLETNKIYGTGILETAEFLRGLKIIGKSSTTFNTTLQGMRQKITEQGKSALAYKLMRKTDPRTVQCNLKKILNMYILGFRA